MSKYQGKLSNIHFVAQEKVGMSVILQTGTERTHDLFPGHILNYSVRIGSRTWVSLLQILFSLSLGCCEQGAELG